MNQGGRRKAWEAGGRAGPAPPRRMLPDGDDLRSVSWWAAVVQFSGMWGFNMATVATVVGTGTRLPHDVVRWCINFGAGRRSSGGRAGRQQLQRESGAACSDHQEPPAHHPPPTAGFCYGGAAFTAAALLFGLEATGSWWRAVVPSRCANLRSISWWSAFFNVHGSVGFLLGGAALYGGFR